MSKPKVLELQREIEEIMYKFRNNDLLMAEAFLQIIHRENIITGNRIRARHGEEQIIPEPVMYARNSQHNRPENLGWIIRIPTSWISETGRGA